MLTLAVNVASIVEAAGLVTVIVSPGFAVLTGSDRSVAESNITHAAITDINKLCLITSYLFDRFPVRTHWVLARVQLLANHHPLHDKVQSMH